MMTITQSTQDQDKFFVQYGDTEIEFTSEELRWRLDDLRQKRFSEKVEIEEPDYFDVLHVEG